MSVVPRSGGRIGVQEGIDMLNAKRMKKDKEVKQNQIEARIKRLVYEEKRAKKLTDMATVKAEKLILAHERHQKELEEKAVRQQRKFDAI